MSSTSFTFKIQICDIYLTIIRPLYFTYNFDIYVQYSFFLVRVIFCRSVTLVSPQNFVWNFLGRSLRFWQCILALENMHFDILGSIFLRFFSTLNSSKVNAATIWISIVTCYYKWFYPLYILSLLWPQLWSLNVCFLHIVYYIECLIHPYQTIQTQTKVLIQYNVTV